MATLSISPTMSGAFPHASAAFCPRYTRSVCVWKQLRDAEHRNSFIFPQMRTDFPALDSTQSFVEADFELLVLL